MGEGPEGRGNFEAFSRPCFDVNETEAITLTTNGIAVLQFRRSDFASLGEEVEVKTPDHTYLSRVEEIRPAPAPVPTEDRGRHSTIPDAHFVVRLIRQTQ